MPAHGALRLPGQLLLDPRALLGALAAEARELGVVIHEGERVVDVDVRTPGPSRVITAGGEWAADSVVLATGTPILDRGLYAFKTQPYRILAVHGTVPDPSAPLLTSVTASGGVTVATAADGGVTVLGGAHPTGVDQPESRHLAAVERFAATHLPGFVQDAVWSGQDYRPFNPIAFVGLLPLSLGRVRFATGFDGWGLTHGTAAATRIVREIAGEPKQDWAADDRPPGHPAAERPHGHLRRRGRRRAPRRHAAADHGHRPPAARRGAGHRAPHGPAASPPRAGSTGSCAASPVSAPASAERSPGTTSSTPGTAPSAAAASRPTAPCSRAARGVRSRDSRTPRTGAARRSDTPIPARYTEASRPDPFRQADRPDSVGHPRELPRPPRTTP